MTVLELLVVLGIVAGATAMAAASMPRLQSGEASAVDRVGSFVREARLAAMNSGRPVVLEVGRGVAQIGERRLSWDSAELHVLAGGQPVRDYRAVVSAEGVIGGAVLGYKAGATTGVLPGVYREVAR